MDNVYSIFGVTPDPNYEFPVVLAAHFWRQAIGIEPHLFLTRDESSWKSVPRSAVVLRELQKAEFRITFIGSFSGCREGTIAQSVRIHASAGPFEKEDYLITTDADLLPLDRSFYQQADLSESGKMTFWNSGCYNYSRHCLCHIGGKAGVWREVMQIDPSVDVVGAMHSFVAESVVPLIQNTPEQSKKDVEWGRDEAFVSALIQQCSWYPEGCKMIDRGLGPGIHFPPSRIDRTGWPSELGSLDGKMDSHLLRPAHVDGNWEKVRRIVELRLPEFVSSASAYREAYVSAAGG